LTDRIEQKEAASRQLLLANYLERTISNEGALLQTLKTGHELDDYGAGARSYEHFLNAKSRKNELGKEGKGET